LKKRAPRSRRLTLQPLETRAVPAGLDATPGDFMPDRIIVRAENGLPPSDAAASATPIGFGLFSVMLNPGTTVRQAVAEYEAMPGVEFAEPDYVLHADLTPNDPSFGSLYGLNNTGQSGGTVDADIDAPEAWNVSTGSGAMIVAVIDSGVLYTHADLAGNMWQNPGEVAGDGVDNDGNGRIDDVHGYDFINNDANPIDDNGHGTHVAGTIGAVGNNGVGVAGVNWDVQIMALKFLGSNGSGPTSAAVSCLNYAVAEGAKISNNSWGGGGFSSSMNTALNAARTAGHIFVAAAGNNGTNNDTSPHYPSNYSQDNILSVANSTRTDALNSGSNYGATTVDLAAPGTSIVSTWVNGGYASLTGTSMAAPHVAGAAALVWDAHPAWTHDQVITALKSTVDVKPAFQGKMVTNGRLNVDRAIRFSFGGDTSGPRVTAHAFSGSAVGTLNNLRVTFNEAVNPTTFAAADVAFTGPGGAITVTGVTPVPGSSTQFDIAFATQTTSGTYTAVIGPNLTDTAGNAMDQDQNGAGVGTDTYTATATLDATGPRVTAGVFNPSPTTNISSLRLTFNEAVNPNSFTAADVALTGPAGSIAVTGVIPVAGSGSQFDVTFAAQTATGTYTAVVGPNITDSAGNAMDQNVNSVNGEAGDTFTTSTSIVDTTGPRITTSSFAPGGTSISSLRVTFTEAINAASFDATDVALTGPGGAITVTGVAPVAGSGTQFDITFATQTASGTYTATVGPGVTDVAGNAMDQDQNGIGVGTDSYTTSTTISSVVTRTYNSTDVPKSLPDVTTTSSILVVNEDIAISDLNVRFNITHTYDSDLRITLFAPDNTAVMLVNRRGGSANNFNNTVLDDEAATSIASGAAPFANTYRPEAPLTAFDGKNVRGTWRLQIQDLAQIDVGTLNSWSITITGTPIESGGGLSVGGKAAATAVDPTGVSTTTGRRTAAAPKAGPASRGRKVPVRATPPVAVSAPVKAPTTTIEWQGTESPFIEL
jgi:subtilisin family serine protease/subtilisin-like proprotein convertase family protein